MFYGALAANTLGYIATEPVSAGLMLLLLAGLLAPSCKVAATHKQWRAGQVPKGACKTPQREVCATDWDTPFVP